MAARRPTAITSLAEAPDDGKLNWLIYGKSGDGKTVLAGTAPRSLFLTTEAAGTESAKAFGSSADEWICDDWASLQEAYRYLRDGGCADYDWVSVDSLSEMEELCWKDQLEEAHASNKSRSVYQAAIQDYAIVDNKVKALVDSFNRLPVNVLYTAQVMALGTEDAEGDEITMRLPLLGRVKGGAPLSNKICGKVTMIGLLVVKEGEGKDDPPFRRLVTAGGETWVAKDRHDAFGAWIDAPDISEMEANVNERKAAGSRGKQKPVGAKKVPTKGKEKVA